VLTAVETTGTIERSGKIVIDEIFSVDAPTAVRAIVLFPETGDLIENEWLESASKNEAFDFLKDSWEDIYYLTDGKPLVDEK